MNIKFDPEKCQCTGVSSKLKVKDWSLQLFLHLLRFFGDLKIVLKSCLNKIFVMRINYK